MYKEEFYINFEKNKSFELSKSFFEQLERSLNIDNINGHYNVFNSCREQGFVLTIYEIAKTPEINIWASMCKNTDDLMIILGTEKDRNNINSMFSDDAYQKRKFFKDYEFDKAIKYITNNIKATFPHLFVKPANFNFQINRKLEDLERIVLDAESLDYEDYHDLATFDDFNENYFCDLIIMDGKVGLRYSVFHDRNNNDYENLTFEEFNPNLESELSLMLGMKERLDQFIKGELEYDIQMNTDIKI